MTVATTQIHQHAEEILGKQVYFHLMLMQKSIFVWVGISTSTAGQAKSPSIGALKGLNLAVPTKFERMASVTNLIPQGLNDPSEQISQHLATKFKRPIFLSCDLQVDPLEDIDIIIAAERALFKFIDSQLDISLQ
ncbi:hypothetical protein HDU67_003909 [Dinochytrium kinnereticum]|nr:hypothetical protein HDU67_003909 [Dinochytrium kinnereticum]